MSRKEVVQSIKDDCESSAHNDTLLEVQNILPSCISAMCSTCLTSPIWEHPFADSVNYFVSGKGDMEAYDPECLFADPFAGFNGVQRFKQNVSNLGGLM